MNRQITRYKPKEIQTQEHRPFVPRIIVLDDTFKDPPPQQHRSLVKTEPRPLYLPADAPALEVMKEIHRHREAMAEIIARVWAPLMIAILFAIIPLAVWAMAVLIAAAAN